MKRIYGIFKWLSICFACLGVIAVVLYILGVFGRSYDIRWVFVMVSGVILMIASAIGFYQLGKGK